MSSTTPEFEPGHQEETEDEPLDGRHSQPVAEGSSDDPRTLETLDPLHAPEQLLETDGLTRNAPQDYDDQDEEERFDAG